MRKAEWRTAFYCRLSREDGDKPESNSIAGQRAVLEEYAGREEGLRWVHTFTDDGYTGTNFDRPGFQAMRRAIEDGEIDCVMVKDLSRFGRDYLDTGQYLERWFPAHGVRFIAVGDGIDSGKGDYDLLLPFKNVFNEQYARDISQKVRASLRAKQEKGLFVGAFASYGYRKMPGNRNRLEIDPPAAAVVQRVFSLFERGMGKVAIARALNAAGVPCPSEYKRLRGERYRNGQRLGDTTYWTYATIHRMLQNRMYMGDMAQGKSPRAGMHGRARRQAADRWAVVPETHEAIIPPAQFWRVQELLTKRARQPDFQSGVGPLAGFLRCGDCGRAMVKTVRGKQLSYQCGSYKRYGPSVCSRHGISHREIEGVVLRDLNRVLRAVGDLETLAEEAAPPARGQEAEQTLRAGLERLSRLGQSCYEDYREGLLTREELLRYRADYAGQEEKLRSQLALLEGERESAPEHPWLQSLLAQGELTELDRETVAETVEEIRVFADGHLEITYAFADTLGLFLTEAGEGDAH